MACGFGCACMGELICKSIVFKLMGCCRVSLGGMWLWCVCMGQMSCKRDVLRLMCCCLGAFGWHVVLGAFVWGKWVCKRIALKLMCYCFLVHLYGAAELQKCNLSPAWYKLAIARPQADSDIIICVFCLFSWWLELAVPMQVPISSCCKIVVFSFNFVPPVPGRP